MATKDDIQSTRTRKTPLADDLVQAGFSVVKEVEVGFVELGSGYGIPPLVAALELVANDLASKPSPDGRDYAGHNLTYRFAFDGQSYKFDVEVR